MRMIGLVFLLAGCPFVGGDRYDDRVRDLDGDGGGSVRFGGPDCLDDNPEINDCDADGDGHLTVLAGGDDCDDAAADVFPGAPERCDGIDNDCDGALDNDDLDVVSDNVFYVDQDGDGDGDPTNARACQEYLLPNDPGSAVFVNNDDDCNDDDPALHTGATEVCDGIDNNCDGLIDEVGNWFVDADGDGFGDSGLLAVGSCDLSNTTGLSGVGGDCDDSAPNIYPGAPEHRYDGVDDNCNGGLDDWDGDLDGRVPAQHWAAAEAANLLLPIAERWSIEAGDCDDDDPRRFDGNPEVCDGVDNDCDSLVDVEDLNAAGALEEGILRGQVQTAYFDQDGDGYFGTEIQLCPADVHPTAHSLVLDDCYDGGAAGHFGSVDPTDVYVGAPELCDGVDNDCDQRADWSFDAFAGGAEHYIDGDGDGYGAAVVFACGVLPAEGIVADGGDCNDGDVATFPGAPEVCGDIFRQDCSTASIWDCDADGQEGAYNGNGTGQDCDDQDGAVYQTLEPAFEVCDGIDNDCDGLIDSADLDNLDTSTLVLWYPDLDDDGWGLDDGFPIQQCDAPSEFAAHRDGDCDDNDPALDPTTPWYEDVDGDGFGETSTATVSGCTPPPTGHWVRLAGDCNDLDPIYNPLTEWFPDVDGDFVGDPSGRVQFCSAPAGTSFVLASAGIDCDDTDDQVQGTGLWYRDNDNDGWGDATITEMACAEPFVGGSNYTQVSGDCDDHDPTVNPERVESCNAVDDDCDGLIDDLDPNLVAVGGGPVGFLDEDGDGFGLSTAAKNFCFTLAPGWALASGDCDDTNGDVYPGQIEVCGNGIDDDCTGDEQVPVWYVDDDGDGFGGGTASAPSCTAPAGFSVTTSGDCDDHQALSFPGAPERDACDTIDDNCDGAPEPRLTWYFDGDSDGFGDDALQETTCVPPSDPPIPGATGDWVLSGGDCDDADASITFGRLWYVDSDGDSLGNDTAAFFDCPVFDLGGMALPSFLIQDLNGNGAYDAGDIAASIFAGDCDDDNALVGAARGYRIDQDGDGWGSNNVADTLACPDAVGNPPAGFVTRGGDCVDVPADDPDTLVPPEMINPEFPEVLGDDADNDCDGFTDQVGGGIAWFEDLDGDGLGGLGLPGYAPGAVTNGQDCDDNDAGVANGLVLYTDLDGDSYGSGPGVLTAGTCAAPTGFSRFGGDCDDTLGSVNPGISIETCDGIDENCNGIVDEGLTLFGWEDRDGDGVGDPNAPGLFCPGDAFALPTAGEDCDDFDVQVHPGAIEICDGIDNNCVGGIGDEVVPLWYLDGDADGHGSEVSVVQACVAPTGPWLATSGDCDDGDPLVNPAASEVCNGIDDDCANGIDDGQSVLTVYRDADGDGAVLAGSEIQVCAVPVGYTTVAGPADCDDNDALESPTLAERCGDGLDNNCDNNVDDMALRYIDLDSDGWGWGFLPLEAASCSSLVHADQAGDCDDGTNMRNPGLLDTTCDGIDNDCNTLVDDGVPIGDQTTYYRDLDGDTYGDSEAALLACVVPTGYVLDATDCDDLRSTAFPGATELCNGLDDNCDMAIEPSTTWYADLDQDNYRDSASSVVICDTEAPPAFFDLGVSAGVDCDDRDASVHPGAVEYCDAIDSDCNPANDAMGQRYADTDGDGWGVGTTSLQSCGAMLYAEQDGDCDDGNSLRNPGFSTDACDAIDNDCDGGVDEDADFVTYYANVDGDAYGNPFLTVEVCDGIQPVDTLPVAGDCDDQRASVNPMGTEVCNGLDDDCSGAPGPQEVDMDGDGYLACQESNDGDPLDVPGAPIWYFDGDGDGFGSAATMAPRIQLASPGVGWTVQDGDCDDTDRTVNPGMLELCDGKDNNCDRVSIMDQGIVVSWDVTDLGGEPGTPMGMFALAHDVDGDGEFSIDGPIFACDINLMLVAPYFDQDGLAIQVMEAQPETPQDLPVDLPDCRDGTNSVINYYVYDGDGDGVPAPGDLGLVRADCGQGPPSDPGWVQVDTSMTAPDFDCDRSDPDKWQTLGFGEFGDVDGDGFVSIQPSEGACVGGIELNPGFDCDDFDPFEQNDAGAIMVNDQQLFDTVWMNCTSADMTIDTSLSFPAFASAPFVNFTIRTAAGGSCSEASNATCILGPAYIGDGGSVVFRDLGIEGAVFAVNGADLVFDNVDFRDGGVVHTQGTLEVLNTRFKYTSAVSGAVALDLDKLTATIENTMIDGGSATGLVGVDAKESSLLMNFSSINNVMEGVRVDGGSFNTDDPLGMTNVGAPLTTMGSSHSEVMLNLVNSGSSFAQLDSVVQCRGCVFDSATGTFWAVGDNATLELVDGIAKNDTSMVPAIVLEGVDPSVLVVGFATTASMGPAALARPFLQLTDGTATIEGLGTSNLPFNTATPPFVVVNGSLALRGFFFDNNGMSNSPPLVDLLGGVAELVDLDVVDFSVAKSSGTLLVEDSEFRSINAGSAVEVLYETVDVVGTRVFLDHLVTSPFVSFVTVANGATARFDGSIFVESGPMSSPFSSGPFSIEGGIIGGASLYLGTTSAVVNPNYTGAMATVASGTSIYFDEALVDGGSGCVYQGGGTAYWDTSWITNSSRVDTDCGNATVQFGMSEDGQNPPAGTGPSAMAAPDWIQTNPAIVNRFGETAF